MKARLVFARKHAVALKFGGKITVFMDCYQVDDLKKGFKNAFIFSWVAYDSSEPSRRVLMDQHTGRPCHLHVGQEGASKDVEVDSVESAIEIFWAEVKNYFGEILEGP